MKPKDKFTEIIKTSGHNFHLEIVYLLKKNGWQVEISPYYYDDIDDKPREIDIVATKPVAIFKDPNQKPGYNIYLFIECKHIGGEVVFWTDSIDNDKIRGVINNSIVNLDIDSQDIDSISKNHYLKVPYVAKLFETKQKERKSNQDIIFSAFTQTIKSLIYFKEKGGLPGIYYPIVVYEPKSKFAIYTEDNEKQYKLLDEREIILEINYSYKSRERYYIPTEKEVGLRNEVFLIDFIDKDNFEGFLGVAIYEEIEEINKILWYKSKRE